MVIKPMIRSNICINAHPAGCAKETERQIAYVQSRKSKRGIKTAAEGGTAPKAVLVLGPAMVLPAGLRRHLSMVQRQSAYHLKKKEVKKRVELPVGTIILPLTGLPKKQVSLL